MVPLVHVDGRTAFINCYPFISPVGVVVSAHAERERIAGRRLPHEIPLVGAVAADVAGLVPGRNGNLAVAIRNGHLVLDIDISAVTRGRSAVELQRTAAVFVFAFLVCDAGIRAALRRALEKIVVYFTAIVVVESPIGYQWSGGDRRRWFGRGPQPIVG